MSRRPCDWCGASRPAVALIQAEDAAGCFACAYPGADPAQLVGLRFVMLTVESGAEDAWCCRCLCGAVLTAPGEALRGGLVISCGGCTRWPWRSAKARRITHGTDSLTVQQWAERLRVKRSTLAMRVRIGDRKGWSTAKVLRLEAAA